MILQICIKLRHTNSELWLDYRQKQKMFLFVSGSSPFLDSSEFLLSA